MTEEEFTIVLPLPAKVLSPNSRLASHGGVMMKAAATKRYRRLAREAVEAEGVESAPWEYAKVAPLFYYRDKRRRDQDNAMASLKAAYDGIVDSGLVQDDDYKHMGRTIPEFHIDREYPRVELIITRVTPPGV
jgi:crossover junction endodeoxyribonuclease RusA